MQGKLFQRCTHLLYCSVLTLGGDLNTRRMSKPEIHLWHKKSMKYSGHRKLLWELSKLSKFNALNLLGYYSNTDVSVVVYKFRPERTGFNMYAEYTQLQLTFLALQPCLDRFVSRSIVLVFIFKHKIQNIHEIYKHERKFIMSQDR